MGGMGGLGEGTICLSREHNNEASRHNHASQIRRVLCSPASRALVYTSRLCTSTSSTPSHQPSPSPNMPFTTPSNFPALLHKLTTYSPASHP